MLLKSYAAADTETSSFLLSQFRLSVIVSSVHVRNPAEMGTTPKRPRRNSRPSEPILAEKATDIEDSASPPKLSADEPSPATSALSPFIKNKTKVLLLSTRGLTTRPRHLMDDLLRLLPHAKKESKLDTKDNLSVATEVADLRSCDTVMLFEARKHMDTFLWLAKSPFGPSVKFHVDNLHTMRELSFPGNNLMHSRPIVTFDPAFDTTPFLKLLKELLTQTFSAPADHRRTKPFVDHIISLSYLDNRIWFRHYQIVDAALNEKVIDKSVESTLVEIGPRFVLNPIKCFSGAFKGAVLWENAEYVSPNLVRRAVKKRLGDKVTNRIESRAKRRKFEAGNPIEIDDIHKTFR